ncbi:class I SAM-dependent methyltransferase [Spirillospora sp. NBC_00431]
MGNDEDTNLFDLADVYEAIYRGRGKDYAGEAELATKLIKERNPSASSLLDVACGPGAHLVHFIGSFERVAGVDLSADMVRVARERLGEGVPVSQGDMRDFRLDRTFGAVTCMFSSIAYSADTAELEAALGCLAGHLEPGGVVVVEPWWFPENFVSGYVGGSVVTVEGRTIARVSHSVVDGRATRMDVHYTVASSDEGIRHFVDQHRMSLFGKAEYEAAFTRAGCSVEYFESETVGPGLFVGVRQP